MTHEPEREVLISRDSDDTDSDDSDDNDSVLFDKSKVVTSSGEVRYKTDAPCAMSRWAISVGVLVLAVVFTFLVYVSYHKLLPIYLSTSKTRFNKTGEWLVNLRGSGKSVQSRFVSCRF